MGTTSLEYISYGFAGGYHQGSAKYSVSFSLLPTKMHVVCRVYTSKD
jgi:hypothetical protein